MAAQKQQMFLLFRQVFKKKNRIYLDHKKHSDIRCKHRLRFSAVVTLFCFCFYLFIFFSASFSPQTAHIHNDNVQKYTKSCSERVPIAFLFFFLLILFNCLRFFDFCYNFDRSPYDTCINCI